MSIANPYAKDPEAQQLAKLQRSATIASLSVAVVLIVAKLGAYFVTDSVSVLTSLMDSMFDAVASSITMISVIHAAHPADQDHRFGHGKLEALAAMGQSLFIFGSGGYLAVEAVHRFIHPQPIKEIGTGMIVMLFSIALTIGLVSFQRYVMKKSRSVAISADHLHYTGDLFMNLGVLAALALSQFSAWPYFDPLFAAGTSLIMLYGARKISRESFDILMDKELSNEERAKIEELVNAHPETRAIHDLRTRHSSRQVFIEFHLELDGELSLKKAHDITEEIELILYKAFPQSEVLIHQEPAGIDDHRLDNAIQSA